MPSLYINGLQTEAGVDATISVQNPDGSGLYTYNELFTAFGWIDGDGTAHDYPAILPLPSSITNYVTVLTATFTNGCVYQFSYEGCTYPTTPTPTPITCYYVKVGPLAFGHGETLNYTDCFSQPQTFVPVNLDSQYFCVSSWVENNDFIVELSGQYCTYVDTGISPPEWIPPILVTLTQTPTLPELTNTPSIPILQYDYFYLDINVQPGGTLNFYDIIFEGVLYIDWGEGPIQEYNNNDYPDISYTYIGSYNGQIRISGETTTIGEVQSISSLGFVNDTISYNGYSNTGLIYGVTASTSELSKLINCTTMKFNSSICTGVLSDLTNLTNLQTFISRNNNLTGDIADLPDSLVVFRLPEKFLNPPMRNTITGNIANIPTNINEFEILGANTISGNVSSIVSHIWSEPLDGALIICGNSTITGLMSNLPNISTIELNTKPAYNIDYVTTPFYRSVTTGNTITGTLTLKSNQKEIIIWGGNTISGAIAGLNSSNPDVIDTLDIAGLNTITGLISNVNVLPNSRLIILGNNTISGSITYNGQPLYISTIVIAQLGNIVGWTYDTNAQGSEFNKIPTIVNSGNTITGPLSQFNEQIFPALTNLVILGNNTLSGNIQSLPPSSISILQIVSNSNTIRTFTSVQNQPLSYVFTSYGELFVYLSGINTPTPNSNDIDNFLEYLSIYHISGQQAQQTIYIKLNTPSWAIPSSQGLSYAQQIQNTPNKTLFINS